MLKRIAIFLLGLSLTSAAAAATQPIDSIVAVVNDTVILRSELDLALNQVRRQFAGRSNLPPENVLERQVLERQVLKELQVQSAERAGVRVSESDVDQSLERMARQNNITVPQLRDSVVRDGFDFAEFRRNVREQLIIEQMHTRVAENRVEVSETELNIQLDKQPANNTEYHLATILVGVPEGASPQEVQSAEQEARTLYRELNSGGDFAEAAIAQSDARNALQGGDLGWRRNEQIPPQFADVVNRLEPGDVGPPIRAAGGFYILKLLEERQAQAVMVPERHARHILIQPDELISDQQAYEQIVDLRRRIVSGDAEFAELAEEHSDDVVTGTKGGDLGWFGPTEYGTRIDETLATMQEGQISQPFRTGGGWHIIQLLDTRQADRTEEMRRERAREAIRERKREEEIELWLRQLRASAYVDLRI